jgi:hypothetical protein
MKQEIIEGEQTKNKNLGGTWSEKCWCNTWPFRIF